MVDWPVQAERTHKELLTRFSCADPATEKYEPHRGKWHPRPWQLEVQKQIRTLGLPRPDYERMLLSFHEDGEVGAVFLGRKSRDRPPMFIVNLLAVRADLHRLGVRACCSVDWLSSWNGEMKVNSQSTRYTLSSIPVTLLVKRCSRSSGSGIRASMMGPHMTSGEFGWTTWFSP